MITYDALINKAKERGMPTSKFRGIIREYLQVLILKALYKNEAGRKLFFTGGTYLRFTHELKRFSEDMDFNTVDIQQSEFECLLGKIRKELQRVNIDSLLKFSHWRNIYSASLIFPTIEKEYNVKSSYSKKAGIVIKIETNRPKWRIKKETHVVTGYGEIYPCICTDISALFADKVDALQKKTRGRHLYDIIYMLSRNFPIDREVLTVLGINGDPLNIIENRIRSFSEPELKKQAEVLRPFLFEEDEAELIIKAHTVIPSLIKKYRRKLN